MKKCQVCNGTYNYFKVIIGETHHEFDCFECAIQALAPTCYRCGNKIIGHVHTNQGKNFCDSLCAWNINFLPLTERQSVIHFL
jgi:hypothetical protein